CHVNNNYNLTSANTACYGCHTTDWNSTQTLGGNVPNHVTAGFPTAQCSTCHDTVAWVDGKFDHSTTGFTLTGAHVTTACALCHVNGNYSLTSANTACYGCHTTDWNSTQTLGGNVPNHVTAGFPTAQCATCHDTVAWVDGKFDHSTTGFTLTGAHVTTACALCHVNGNYGLTSANTACYGCHTTDWNSTQTLGGNVPNHVTAGFPTAQCSTCHDTVAWVDGKFDHSTTGWALTGAHTTTACALCHVNGNYTLTSANTACYGCHTADWNSTQTLGGSVPNHVAAGYPTTCDTCHTTTAWTGATFNHTYFPIPHHGSVCSDCHQVSTDYSSFTCINCHTQTAHQQSQTNNEHNGVGGYSYGPTTCYNCHKNGGGG
ncbi:MAG TPA: multiheme c-type cytochrome, partial [Candidatus Acidoferrum sp.]